MVCPLVEDIKLWRVTLFEDAVLGDNGEVKRGDKLVYAVVYLGVEVVRSAGNDDDRHILLSCFGDHSLALGLDLGHILFECVHSLNISCGRLLLGDAVVFERFGEDFCRVLREVYVDIRRDEILIVKFGDIRTEQLGIICNNGAVIMVIAFAVVDIVAFAGIEDEVSTLFEQADNMSVRKLRRVAYRIGRDSVLTLIVGLSCAFLGDNDLKAKLCEKLCPERELFIKSECERDSDLCLRCNSRLFICL